MIVQFSKWGNSLALRIPSHAMRDIGAIDGTEANLIVEEGRLIITPIVKKRRYNLDELVARITEENFHEEIFDGPEVGSEEW
ncbi:MAG: PbsX family transcriptional regulator [Methylorubrum populi]